ncbi:hypothetical protein B0H13DRAFT_2342384 [Mycena leptocephala]|nr:hypothetical protein B0H13DRAFT_2342384 [Mycena leptocephala]
MNSEFAQEPLEPPRGFRTVRKLVAPPPNYDVNGSLVALLSHQPAIFAQRPRATRWLQWLLRKPSNITLKGLLEQTADRLYVVNAALEKTKSDAAQYRVRKFCEFLTEETSSIDVLLKRRAWERILESEEDKQNIVRVVTRIEAQLRDFQIDVVMSIERNTEAMMEQLNALRIDSWPRSKNVTYGADLDSTLLRHEACTLDTRVSILRGIKE